MGPRARRNTRQRQGRPGSQGCCDNRQAKERARQDFEEYWAQNMPKRYADLEILFEGCDGADSDTGLSSIERKLLRFTLGKLYASRTGHGDFKDYHLRCNHEDAECHCQCSSPKSPDRNLTNPFSADIQESYARFWKEFDQTAAVSCERTIEEALHEGRKIGDLNYGMLTGSLHLVSGALYLFRESQFLTP
ncbi:uncharacterized protein BDCG_00599 [Blastomyces dermatitidis ER-3]|uniref:Uncharacterized protein n=1 Tax=Ajellomyces dermatitidis (strain ER-3 / ATCC MYA-2586) TaxID=559297 RepID=A0ABP2ER07_AJEDR|nr:uncharacterized protein BDCG_00599 [Blastomyces dermatitidis ER-3]EEQ83794.2 hypothetical protein BDCG_00599 [Blastomyces dermatitidis ER-3]